MAILRRPEINEALGALGLSLAGEHDGDKDAAQRAQRALHEVPKGGAMVGFSASQIRLLWTALEAGAEAILQPTSGLTPFQRQSFREAANRLGDAGNISHPRF